MLYMGNFLKLLLLLLLLLGKPTQAQTLEKLLSNADPLSTIPTKALATLVKQLAPLESEASPEQQLIIDLFKIRHLAITGKFPAALSLLTSFDSPSVAPSFRVRAYTIAIPIHHMQGNYILAFDTLNKIQQLIPWVDNDNLKYLAISLAPELYTDAGDLDTALTFSLKAIDAANKTNGLINLCTAYDAYSGILFKQGDLEAATTGFKKMMDYCSRKPAPLFLGTAHAGLAGVLQEQKHYQEAIEHYTTALSLHGETDFQFGIAHDLLGLAQNEFALDRAERAQAYLEEALPILESIGVLEQLVDTYNLKGKISEQKYNYQEALAWYKKQWTTEKKVMDNKKAIRIAQLQVAFEVKNKEQHIDLLEKKNELLALQKRSTLLYSWLVILGLAVIALTSALLWRKARRESSHFKHLSQVDPLTGLYNHAYCYSLAEQNFHQCNRNNQPFVVIVADIDWFKQVNDTYGHAAGDKVLQSIASVLQKHMGSRGIAGRTGGEEFTCFLPGLSLDEAITIVKACRDDMQPVTDYGKDIEVTLSYGLAVSHGEYDVLDILVREADEALYEAKDQGRNQIIVHGNTEIRKKA
jgi:diguanylate cyclase (GGDEF)-like protein